MKPTHAKPSLYAYCYETLKDIAVTYGYNLVLHGSMNRDLDLIAIPWQDKLGSVSDMLLAFCEALGGELNDKGTEMYHGRIAYVVNLNRAGKWNNYVDAQYYLDISVIPTIE